MMLRGEKKKSREVSLNEPIGVDKEGNTISLIDVIENKEMDIVGKIQLKDDVLKIKDYVDSELNKREREVITKRYGLNGDKPLTQKNIASNLGISRSYVSRIEKRALEKLKLAFDNIYKK